RAARTPAPAACRSGGDRPGAGSPRATVRMRRPGSPRSGYAARGGWQRRSRPRECTSPHQCLHKATRAATVVRRQFLIGGVLPTILCFVSSVNKRSVFVKRQGGKCGRHLPAVHVTSSSPKPRLALVTFGVRQIGYPGGPVV